jgi:hypothetical protein
MIECSRCGAALRSWDETHECERRDASIQYNLATTDEQQAIVSEAIRQAWKIPEQIWYANRPRRATDPDNSRTGDAARLAPGPAPDRAAEAGAGRVRTAVG